MTNRSLGLVGTAFLVGTVLPWFVAETERSSASAEAIDKTYTRIAGLASSRRGHRRFRKPGTSGTSSGTGRPRTRGSGMGGPSRSVSDSAGSSTRRSATRLPAWTTRYCRRKDERDNILNVIPHAQFVGNARTSNLPALSRGTGEPQPAARLELTTVDVVTGAAKAFETVLRADQSTLQGETLWYRMVAGGTAPRYVRLRPRPSLSAVLDGRTEQALPGDDVKVNSLIAKATVEILTLRPTMSYGLPPVGAVR